MANARRASSITAIAAGIALVALGAIFFGVPKTPFAYATGAGSLGGYAWSDNVGWISLNCATGGPNGSNICASNNYYIAVGTDGTLSGDAWSDNIGWISANAADLAGCPTAPCMATMIDGKLAGWLKALSADGRGWDGWISLSGSGYGPVASGGTFTNYAWGSDVVGWVSFADATSQCTPVYRCVNADGTPGGQIIQETDKYCVISNIATCTEPSFCSDGSKTCLYPPPEFVPFSNPSGTVIQKLTILPSIVRSGDTAQVYWNVENVSSCTVTSSVAGVDQWTSAADAGCNTDTHICASPAGGKTSSPITQHMTYALDCTGLDSTPLHQTATVDIVPIFKEH